MFWERPKTKSPAPERGRALTNFKKNYESPTPLGYTSPMVEATLNPRLIFFIPRTARFAAASADLLSCLLNSDIVVLNSVVVVPLT